MSIFYVILPNLTFRHLYYLFSDTITTLVRFFLILLFVIGSPLEGADNYYKDIKSRGDQQEENSSPSNYQHYSENNVEVNKQNTIDHIFRPLKINNVELNQKLEDIIDFDFEIKTQSPKKTTVPKKKTIRDVCNPSEKYFNPELYQRNNTVLQKQHSLSDNDNLDGTLTNNNFDEFKIPQPKRRNSFSDHNTIPFKGSLLDTYYRATGGMTISHYTVEPKCITFKNGVITNVIHNIDKKRINVQKKIKNDNREHMIAVFKKTLKITQGNLPIMIINKQMIYHNDDEPLIKQKKQNKKNSKKNIPFSSNQSKKAKTKKIIKQKSSKRTTRQIQYEKEKSGDSEQKKQSKKIISPKKNLIQKDSSPSEKYFDPELFKQENRASFGQSSSKSNGYLPVTLTDNNVGKLEAPQPKRRNSFSDDNTIPFKGSLLDPYYRAIGDTPSGLYRAEPECITFKDGVVANVILNIIAKKKINVQEKIKNDSREHMIAAFEKTLKIKRGNLPIAFVGKQMIYHNDNEPFIIASIDQIGTEKNALSSTEGSVELNKKSYKQNKENSKKNVFFEKKEEEKERSNKITPDVHYKSENESWDSEMDDYFGSSTEN